MAQDRNNDKAAFTGTCKNSPTSRYLCRFHRFSSLNESSSMIAKEYPARYGDCGGEHDERNKPLIHPLQEEDSRCNCACYLCEAENKLHASPCEFAATWFLFQSLVTFGLNLRHRIVIDK